MIKTPLVSIDLEQASQIVKALERSDLKLNVALWLYLSEYEDWRLVEMLKACD